MWQKYGVKVRVLTWGGLTDTSPKDVFRGDNPYSDIWLNCKKSAEVIVPHYEHVVRDGLNIRRFSALNNSNKLQRKQTTQYRGRLVEVGVELRGKQRALRKSLALAKGERENNVVDDTSNLIEKISDRQICLKL